jgi:hypothetical protein
MSSISGPLLPRKRPLERTCRLVAFGPISDERVFEPTGLPYRPHTFRQAWRHDADVAGIPKAVWNRDLRAGGNTEGQDAGAALEDRRKVTGHSTDRTTAKVYDPGVLAAHRRVARARAKVRPT